MDDIAQAKSKEEIYSEEQRIKTAKKKWVL